ncbi:hypothetical protein [Parasitella parasitica]|uniref:Thc1 RRM domain-containing protein n=1 Tax=Parasitella parasitica TaxID=35722 RepID=A0A0B7N856_9FUNG|nr:hypothetical protein [Parasitella parasitica]
METKSKRSVLQPYIPVHRRNQPEKATALSSLASTRTLPKEEAEVRRRGRGQFRAPINEEGDTTSNIYKESKTNIQNSKNDIILENLTAKVENFTVKSNDDDKEDWEEEFEIESDSIKKVESNKTIFAKEPVPLINDDELTTTLDCYDFPSSFKTYHLQEMFREYESMKGGYSIKWMDDTRALIVFEHPNTAKRAYIDHINSPFVKIRPYKGHVENKPSGPVPRRPATTDMVAKRLVHSALGVRSIKTEEQRHAEKELLKAAKEQRLAEKAYNAAREKQIASAFDD